MAAPTLAPMPEVTRVGFDHGWHLLGPSFLNLGTPLLLVDKTFLDPASFGLEVFGDRDPSAPLPRTPLLVERSGRLVGVRDTRTPHAGPLTIGAFANPASLETLTVTADLAIAVGDTWEAQLSWAALWRFTIGLTTIRRPWR